MKLMFVLLLCAAAVCITCEQPPSDEDWLELHTPQGPVRGRRDPNADHLYAFHNIPYATAPVGKDKYKPPLPAPVWEKPYDAINKNIICPQYTLQLYNLKPKNSVEQEDCLIANVYVPDTRKTNISVLVYVHGGGFFGGYGDFLTPKRLLKSKDIVLVTFNYRLGVHGFLCLGTENVPGNAGMKDQIALLRWVQKNIASYGGNPNDVTIAGYSAGSMSVDLLMLSKSAEGLFHKVIPESGGNLATYTIQRDPLEVAQYQAKLLNFTNIDDIHALEEFYRTTPLEQLYYTDILSTRFYSSALFSPCVERETEDEAFLTESPLSILQRGSFKKLPVLYGFAAMEGRGRLAFFEMLKPKMNQNFSDFLPNDLKIDSEKERREVSDKVKTFYFGDKPVGEDNKLGFVNFFTDVTFSHAMLWSVKLYAEAGHKSVYLYEYSFVDENAPLVPPITIRGADHCDQTFAVVDSLDEDLASVEVKNMKKTIRQIWHNFIKTGKPVPEGSSLPAWPAAGAARAPYMSLGQELELRHEPLLETRTLFWDDIYQKYYLQPIPPPERIPNSRIEL